ncbi:glycosyltransferase [Lactobacillus sp. ESL0791]|uniref:PssE/Cps14G family polysaccharide biosynthesis glycosyltransferase n=1 Tax=Lactobacillus sp. ESL0791 TaxID=2983234 RepID=UPI0023F690ED|nr:PssE/Cps14G family polysaccharide biosynthesis glycosyltransferase [Lactobacillus sp. ESL0791]MDF7639825.1 glycosyltransferase [Lactobacillus sp. ESL0791]
MIFVTVGTHEQPFNRLIKKIDQLKGQNKITDEVFIQIGYSTYLPKNCQYQKFVSPAKMQLLIKQASVIITHGGPSSFIEVIRQGKTPIVVPRQKKFNEHVNDHQLTFCTDLQKRGFPIKAVTNIEDLDEAICAEKDNQLSKFHSNNQRFNQRLETLLRQLF